MNRPAPTEPAAHPILHRLTLIALCLAVLLGILGSRWKVIEHGGTDVPEWDQWDAEGLAVFKPWFEKGSLINSLWTAHNEHRVILTKLTNLGLLLANGQWDQRLEAAFNAFLPALLGAGLLFWLSPSLPRWLWPVFAALLAALWGLPLAWQNVLGGFHSNQFYLLNLSVFAIATLPSAKLGSTRCWLAAVSSILLLGSMGSGFFAASTVAGMALLLWWFRSAPLGQWLPPFFLGLVVTAVGYLTRVEFTPHEILKAKSLSDFIGSCLHALQWPLLHYSFAPLVFWTPWLWLTARWLWRKDEPQRDRVGLVLLGFGTWVLLQTIATGLLRGAGAAYPASRYIDTYVFGIFVNAASLVWLLRGRNGKIAKRAGVFLAAAWTVSLAIGLSLESRLIYKAQIPWLADYHRDCERNCRAYLRTQNPAYLHLGRIPYPGVDSLRERLDQPSLGPLLPSSIRPPIVELQPLKAEGFYSPILPEKEQTHAADTHDGLPASVMSLGPEPIWTSFVGKDAATTGVWVGTSFTSPEPYIRLEVAGTFDDPKVRLELRSATTQEIITRIVPRHKTLVSWQPVYIPVPRESVYLQATDESATGWVAFSSPTAMPWLSHLALVSIHEGNVLVLVAALLMLVAVVLIWHQKPEAKSVTGT